MAKPADKVSNDFGRNPGAGIGIFMEIMGLARVLAQGFVARLANIPDMGCDSLRALSQNRDSAAARFIVLGTLTFRQDTTEMLQPCYGCGKPK